MSSWEAYNSGLSIPSAHNLPPVSGVHRGNLHHHLGGMHAENPMHHGMTTIPSPTVGATTSVPSDAMLSHQVVTTHHHPQHVLHPIHHHPLTHPHSVHGPVPGSNSYVHSPGGGQINHHGHPDVSPPPHGYGPPYSLHAQRSTINPQLNQGPLPLQLPPHVHLPLHHHQLSPGLPIGTPPLQHPLPLNPSTTGVTHPSLSSAIVGIAPHSSPHHSFSPRPGITSSPLGGPITATPVPHTPQGPPALNPFSNGPPGPEHDLPPELLALGWRKFWSKRENRLYFWNCSTGESLWEMPPIPGRPHYPSNVHSIPGGHPMYDPLTDPLGIQCNTGPAIASVAVKRRVSSGENSGSPSVKKFILAGPWDLEISTNVIVAEAAYPRKHLLPPHPEIEQLRAQLVAKLRQCYQTACHSRESIDAPKESMNRWLMVQKITDLKGIDPVFPSCDNAEGEVSSSMLREIMNDVPMKLKKCRYTGDARKQLSKYAEACKRMVETRNTSRDDARKVVKWKVEETFSWLRATNNASYEALQERLAHLQETCQPHVHAAARTSVEGICKKMSIFAKQHAQSVREAHMKFVIAAEVKEEDDPVKGRFRCYPAQCGPFTFTETGKLPTVDFLQTDRDHAMLKFKSDAIRVSTQCLQKLEQLYRYNCVEDRKFEFFLVRSYCLLKRYNAFCEDFSSSQTTQGSLPVPVLESIQRNFGVTFECFASPLNCYFRQFCSLFPDIDGYYGSRGNFFEFSPVAGSFAMHPPYSEEIINAAISRAEDLLAATQEPMSFLVFVPESADKDDINLVDKECSWVVKLAASRWKRKQVTVPPYEHEFRHGALHMVSKSEVNIRSSHGTLIVWLQNDAGYEEWSPTDFKVDALLDAYRPGRERERDRQELLAPERQNPHQADKAVAAAAAGATVIST